MNDRTTHGGKGDSPRQIAGDKFRSNYDRIFKKHESNPINPHASNLEQGEREVPNRRHFRADWKRPR
jgi:hypothetical protein